MLDRLHFAKIELADEIMIITVDGYIGASTSREMEYAKRIGKLVRVIDFPSDRKYLAVGDQQASPAPTVPVEASSGMATGLPSRPSSIGWFAANISSKL